MAVTVRKGMLLTPTVVNDTLGDHIVVSCGSVTGQLYLSKLSQSKKVQAKCVVVNGEWFTPSGVEALAGSKARKWRQSFLHLGKPLSAYDLFNGTGQAGASSMPSNVPTHVCSAQGDVDSLCSGHVDCPQNVECTHHTQATVPTADVLLNPNVVVAPSLGQPPSLPLETSTIGEPPTSIPCPLLVNPDLAFIKAYRLKGDTVSLKRLVSERFSNELVEGAKRTLWDSCGSLLTSLPYLARRDSENRSQLMANLEDIIVKAIPDMFCEASALYLLPTLSLDAVGEQVQANTHVLQSLESAVRGIEQKIASLVSLSSSVSVNTASNGVSGGTGNPTQQSVPSYANVASTSLPRPTYTNHPSRIDVRISRECNVILFGLPENNSIVEKKSKIDEVFEFLVGKSVPIKDLFRLGKPTQSLRPRPLLIKLSTIWDRKLLLSWKRNLREYKIARLFLREDVPPDHRLRQKRSTSAKLDAEKSSTLSPAIPVNPAFSGIADRPTSPTLSHSSTSSTSSSHTVVLSQDDLNNG